MCFHKRMGQLVVPPYGAVLHVKYAGNVREFYEAGLEAGVHYVAVDTVEGLPAAVEALRADPARARRIAAADIVRKCLVCVCGGVGEIVEGLWQKQLFPLCDFLVFQKSWGKFTICAGAHHTHRAHEALVPPRQEHD